MIKLEIEKGAIDKLNAKFARLSDLFKVRAIAKLADMVYEKADDLADEHTQTGEMIKSLYIRKKSAIDYEIGFDDEKAPYAKFVHFGSRAHEIKPRNRKFLRWAENAEFIFARKVKHPGYEGDPFLYNAVELEIDPFMAWLDRQISKNVSD